MKRNKLGKLFISVMALMSMTSCHDYLDNTPLDKFPEDAVWSKPASAQLFVNGTYYIIKDFLVGNDDWNDNTIVNAEKADALNRSLKIMIMVGINTETSAVVTLFLKK